MKKLLFTIAIFTTICSHAQTYYLQSNVDIVFNKAGDITGKDTAKLIGKVKAVYWSNDFTSVDVNYQYLSDSISVIKESVYNVKGSEIQVLYDLVKNSIPSGLDKRATENYMFVAAMRILMAQTFSISPNNITVEQK